MLTDAGYELVFGPEGRQPTVAEQLELLEGCVGYLAGVEAITAEVFAAHPQLKVISRNGIGTDAVDLDAAKEHGVIVEVARGANSQGVAELAILHILHALRQLDFTMQAVRGGHWERARGQELASKTVGIVGYGAIGRKVAAIAQSFGAQVLAYDPFLETDSDPALCSLEDLLRQSHVITLHSPPSDTPLMNSETLELVSEGTVLINTARSQLVDDTAVFEALESGKLQAYAVDAFDSEPPAVTDLLRHPRCYPTAHVGGFTDESIERATVFAANNLLAALSR